MTLYGWYKTGYIILFRIHCFKNFVFKALTNCVRFTINGLLKDKYKAVL